MSRLRGLVAMRESAGGRQMNTRRELEAAAIRAMPPACRGANSGRQSRKPWQRPNLIIRPRPACASADRARCGRQYGRHAARRHGMERRRMGTISDRGGAMSKARTTPRRPWPPAGANLPDTVAEIEAGKVRTTAPLDHSPKPGCGDCSERSRPRPACQGRRQGAASR